MAKEYYLEILRQSGDFAEADLKGLSKLSEDLLEKMTNKMGAKKRGRRADVITAEDVISQLKDKPIAPRSSLQFELFTGKGRQTSAGKVQGFFQGYKLYAVVEYYNEKTGQNEKKELDAFKI